METVLKFLPHLIGLLVLIGSVGFFIWRALHAATLLLFKKHDDHERRIRNLELVAVAGPDNKTIMAEIIKGGT